MRVHRTSKLRFVLLLLCLLSLAPRSTVIADTFSTHSRVFETTGLHLNGRFIYDANNVNFVMRGVNHPHTWFREQTGSFAHIKAKGANTVRVVLSSGDYWEPNSAQDVAHVIELCKASELICVLEVHDTTGYIETPAISLAEAVEYWISIKDVLAGEEAYIIINLGNEPYGNDATENWLDDTKDAILAMRTAGFQHMLMVDAPNWGQDWQHHMRDHAAEILAGDPNANTVFSIHMYGVYEDAQDIEDYIATFVNAGLPIVVGEFGHLHSDGDPDEDAILASAQTHGIGYLGWSWSGNSGVGYLDMVTNFNPNKPTAWGKRIFYGENGICLTSVEASIYDGDRDPMTCSIKAADPNPSNASIVNFTVTFSEDVTGVSVDDFILVTTDTLGTTISGVSGSGSAYTVTVNTGSGNGTIGVELRDDDSIRDLSSNFLSGAGIANGNFKWGEVYTIKRSTPVLLSPANGVLVSTLRPNLDWKDSDPAFDHYQTQISINTSFVSPVVDEMNGPDSTFSPTADLMPGTVHYWRVRGINSIGDASKWSKTWAFKTPLAQPVLVAPAEAESLLTDRPAFTWHPVDGATSYILQVSAQSSFATLLVNTTVSGPAYAMPKDLPQNKLLHWRVRARSTIVASPWSAKRMFTTGNPATVPVLIAPVNNALVRNYTPPLNWNDSKPPAGTTIKHYELQLDDDLDFSSPVIETTTAQSLFTPLSDLPTNTKYYWRVRTINTITSTNEDHTSGWSAVWSFRAAILPPSGFLVTPNSSGLTFEWDDAIGPGQIKSYTIQISTSSAFSTFLVNSTSPISSYTMLKTLPVGRKIYWRVRVNGPNGPSLWTRSEYVIP